MFPVTCQTYPDNFMKISGIHAFSRNAAERQTNEQMKKANIGTRIKT